MNKIYINFMVFLIGCNPSVDENLENAKDLVQIDVIVSKRLNSEEEKQHLIVSSTPAKVNRDYFDIIKAEYSGSFKIWGVSSEGGNVTIRTNSDGIKLLQIELFGASGITKAHLGQDGKTLIEKLEFFQSTGMDSTASKFNIEIREDGYVLASDLNGAEEKTYSCLLQEIAEYSFKDIQGDLNVLCDN